MTEIKIGEQVVLVDDADMPLVSGIKWRIDPTGYVKATIRIGYCLEETIQMHRFILGLEKGVGIVDHANGDTIDNRRENLRICSVSQNLMNRGTQLGNKSGYKGVSFHKASRKWRAQVRAKGCASFDALFDSAQEAAHAYNKAAIKLHGEFAVLNPIGEDYASV